MEHDSQIKVEESELMKEQFANDVLLLQLFILEKTNQEISQRKDEQFEINLNNKQEFPGQVMQINKKVQYDDEYYDNLKDPPNKKNRKKKGNSKYKVVTLDENPNVEYEPPSKYEYKKKNKKHEENKTLEENTQQKQENINADQKNKKKLEEEENMSNQINIIKNLENERDFELALIKSQEEQYQTGFTFSGGNDMSINASTWNKCQRNIFGIQTAQNEELLLKVHYMFPKILLTRLKFFFVELGERYKDTIEFLQREFPEYYEPENKRTKFIKYERNHFALGVGDGKDEDNYFDFGGSSFNHNDINRLQQEYMQTRSELQSQSKMYYYLSKCNSNALQKRQFNQSNSYLNMRKNAELKLANLRQKSIALVYAKFRNSNYSKVDLHGLYLDEAEEVTMIILDKITKDMLRHGLSCTDVDIVTGRGSHSSGDAVLFPKINEYLKSQGYQVKASNDRGRLTCTIRR